MYPNLPIKVPADLFNTRTRIGIIVVLVIVGFAVTFVAFSYINQPLIQIINFGQTMTNGTAAEQDVIQTHTNLLNIWNLAPIFIMLSILVFGIAFALRQERQDRPF